jgi:MFS family permease
MELNKKISNKNIHSLIWHAVFLALANNFMDIDTVIPAMILDAGGSSFQLGLLTAVMISSGQVSQLFFASYLSNKLVKKKFLLAGINLRIFSLLSLAALFISAKFLSGGVVILLIFIFIAIFAVSGGFANISYVDIMGKSILKEQRKHFFSIKQIISSIGVLVSAYFARKILQNFNFPQNYTYLFASAGILLTVASLGFWRIHEVRAEVLKISHFRDYLGKILHEVKDNRRLKYYLFVLNTQGVVLVLLPFLILFAKNKMDVANSAVGNYLLLKVIGSVFAGGILFLFARKLKYRYLLYITSVAAIIISLLVMFVPPAYLFPQIFLLAGLIFAFYRMTISGVLLEVTTTQNRALYTGITGAGNILPGLYPILSGWIVGQFSFAAFFITTVLILTLSIFFIYKLNCRH